MVVHWRFSEMISRLAPLINKINVSHLKEILFVSMHSYRKQLILEQLNVILGEVMY